VVRHLRLRISFGGTPWPFPLFAVAVRLHPRHFSTFYFLPSRSAYTLATFLLSTFRLLPSLSAYTLATFPLSPSLSVCTLATFHLTVASACILATFHFPLSPSLSAFTLATFHLCHFSAPLSDFALAKCEPRPHKTVHSTWTQRRPKLKREIHQRGRARFIVS
jgi:hypothetical protein